MRHHARGRASAEVVNTYREAWGSAKQMHMPLLAVNLAARDLAWVADHAIAELAAEIERLTAELDGYQGRTVIHCTAGQLDQAMMASLDEADGTVLRATDTGQEMVMHDRTWLPR